MFQNESPATTADAASQGDHLLQIKAARQRANSTSSDKDVTQNDTSGDSNGCALEFIVICIATNVNYCCVDVGINKLLTYIHILNNYYYELIKSSV